MSIETLPNSDNIFNDDSDDFLTFNLRPQKKKDNEFELDSIVWAPWRQSQWPALVRVINKYKQKLSVVYVDYPCDNRGRECRFQVNMKRVLKFNSSDKSRDLYNNGLKGDVFLREAIKKAEQYLYEKEAGNLFVNPFEYIKDPKSNLFAKHTPKKQKFNENSVQERDFDFDSDSDPDLNVPLATIKRRMAAKLIMKRTEKEEKFSQLVMKEIKSKQCREYLLKIITEKVSCERHKLFKSSTPSDRRLLKYKYLHILSSEQLEKGICTLRTFMVNTCNVPRSYIVDYTMDVWMPEALTFALQNILNLPKERVEASLITGKLPTPV